MHKGQIRPSAGMHNIVKGRRFTHLVCVDLLLITPGKFLMQQRAAGQQFLGG